MNTRLLFIMVECIIRCFLDVHQVFILLIICAFVKSTNSHFVLSLGKRLKIEFQLPLHLLLFWHELKIIDFDFVFTIINYYLIIGRS